MAEQPNRFSTNSFKSQQSIDVNNELIGAPTQNGMPASEEEEEGGQPADDVVEEEDLQSEVDCSSGEYQMKRNSMGSITRATLNFSRQSSEQQQQQHGPIVVEEAQKENVEQEVGKNDQQQEEEPSAAEEEGRGGAKEEIHQSIQNSVPQEARPISNNSMENENNKNVGSQPQASRPVSLLSNNSFVNGQFRPQSMEQKMVASESPNVEEKIFSQIRARNNVQNLIAKFNTATVGDDAKENGGGNKQKSAAENGGGAVNIKAMRQKFGQQ